MIDRPAPRRRPAPTSTRRRFLRTLVAGGALAAGGAAMAGYWRPGGRPGPGLGPLGGSSGERTASTAHADAAAGRLIPGAVDGRVLVVIDLQGGNDGLSTLVPAGDPIYYDYRPNLAVPAGDVLALDDEVGLHPALAGLHRRGITTVEGVGPFDGDLSHFAMTERWERGDVRGDQSLRTGFLGRLCDALDDGGPLIGASMVGPTPHLANQGAATMALTGPDDLWFLEPTEWADAMAYQRGVAAFDGGGHARSQRVVDSFRTLTELAAMLTDSDDENDGIDWELPMIADGGQLGHDLYFAADLIEADVGVRVVYVANGSYDTHSDHSWQQADLLGEVDAAVDGFLGRATELGFDDRVLVATVSEFGRRFPENDSGLDHGSASTMLLAGPVGDRRLGERPALDDLDDDDNLRVSIGFDRYLASLAEEWLGVEAASVLPGEPEPLGLI